MSGLRRNNSTCGSNQQYEPYMLGRSRGYAANTPARQPQTVSVSTLNGAPSSYSYPAPNKTSSLNDATVSVRECMYWPASLSARKNQQYQMQQGSYSPQSNANASYNSGVGDSQYCMAPPKVYMTVPGSGQKAQMRQQSIPCSIAPLGTDPMSMIKPLAPLSVRVQAPPDLFTGNSDQPKVISISPAQLYGGR